MLSPELKNTLESGLSVVVGTCDAALMPECTRSWGIRVLPAEQSVTIFLSHSFSAKTFENLRARQRIAISCTEPETHWAVQLKGQCRAIRSLTDEEDVFWREWRERFKRAIGAVGCRTDSFEELDSCTMSAVDVSVSDVFSQSPGPNAGQRI